MDYTLEVSGFTCLLSKKMLEIVQLNMFARGQHIRVLNLNLQNATHMSEIIFGLQNQPKLMTKFCFR